MANANSAGSDNQAPDTEYRGVRNDLFSKAGFDRGRSKPVEVAWRMVSILFFTSMVPWPSSIKRSLLMAFGARVGQKPYIRPGVYIHFPWKLTIGDYVWIGDKCVLLNLEPIEMQDHSALAHEVYLAAGSHNIRSRTMAYANKPILIKRGTWIATRAMIGPGVVVGENCVVGAASLVLKAVPDNTIVGGNPAKVLGTRTLDQD